LNSILIHIYMKSSKNLYFDLKYASHDLCNDISLGKKKSCMGSI